MISHLDQFYSLSAFAYILSSVITSVIRYFHVCIPYHENKHYYYPGRMVVFAFFLTPLIILPYVYNPSDYKAWILARNFFPTTMFFYSAVLLFNYFGCIKKWYKWRRSSVILAIIAFLAVCLQVITTLIPGYNYSPGLLKILTYDTIIVSLLSMIFCTVSVLKVINWIKETSNDSYSNTDDFPLGMARTTVLIPIFLAIIVWTTFLLNNRMAFAVMLCVLTVFNIWFLILILPSHRCLSQESSENNECQCHEDVDNLLAEDSINNSQQDEKSTELQLPREKVEMILMEIKHAVETEKLYLKPHLTINDVTESCTYGRTYVSRVFKDELGGFYFYINTLRINHASKYAEQHPMATQDEIAAESGFTSHQALYNTRRRLHHNKASKH